MILQYLHMFGLVATQQDTPIGKLIATVSGVIFFFMGYALLPLAARFTGGLVATIGGMANNRSKGPLDFLKNKRSEEMAHNREHIGRGVMQRRADWNDALLGKANSGGRLKRGVMRGAARAVGGRNMEAAMSAKRAAVDKEINDQIASGREEEIRGLTVNRRAADNDWNTGARTENTVINRDGTQTRTTTSAGGLRQQVEQLNAAGERISSTDQYKSLGGAWINDSYVRKGQARWGNDTFAQQAALSYEMRKASSEDDIQGLADRYSTLATGTRSEVGEDGIERRVQVGGGWGNSTNQAAGTWIGASFANQGKHLELKRTNWRNGGVNYDQLAEEMYRNKSTYDIGKMNSNTVKQMSDGYRDAQVQHAAAVGNPERQAQMQLRMDRITAISETFMNGPSGMMPGEDGEAQPAIDGGGARRASNGDRMARTPGSAQLSERVSELADITGTRRYEPHQIPDTFVSPDDAALRAGPNGTRTIHDPLNEPTQNRRRMT